VTITSATIFIETQSGHCADGIRGKELITYSATIRHSSCHNRKIKKVNFIFSYKWGWICVISPAWVGQETHQEMR